MQRAGGLIALQEWPHSRPRSSGAPNSTPASHCLRARNGGVIQTGIRPRRQCERRPTRLLGELNLHDLPVNCPVRPVAPTEAKRPAATARDPTRSGGGGCFVLSRTRDLDNHSGLKGRMQSVRRIAQKAGVSENPRRAREEKPQYPPLPDPGTMPEPYCVGRQAWSLGCDPARRVND